MAKDSTTRRRLLLIFSIATFALSGCEEATCVYDGTEYSKDEAFKDNCDDCVCEADGTVMCEPGICEDTGDE